MFIYIPPIAPHMDTLSNLSHIHSLTGAQFIFILKPGVEDAANLVKCASDVDAALCCWGKTCDDEIF